MKRIFLLMTGVLVMASMSCGKPTNANAMANEEASEVQTEVTADVPTADAADDMNDARRVASKIHGNSLSSNKINYGYQLIDKNNNIVKYGESRNPLTRYSQKWLD